MPLRRNLHGIRDSQSIVSAHSSLRLPHQTALTTAYTRVVDRLRAQGFRSAFVDVEFFVRGETEDEWAAPGAIRVMEVNTRW